MESIYWSKTDEKFVLVNKRWKVLIDQQKLESSHWLIKAGELT